MTPAVKIVFVGDSGVGKTSLIASIVAAVEPDAPDPLPLAPTRPTIGIDFLTLSVPKTRSPSVQLWDTAGLERYAPLTSVYIRNAAAIIFVYDVTRPHTFDRIVTRWAPAVLEAAGATHPPRPLLFIVGNKIDQVAGRIPAADVERRYAVSIGARMHLHVSATSLRSVRSVFFHTIFAAATEPQAPSHTRRRMRRAVDAVTVLPTIIEPANSDDDDDEPIDLIDRRHRPTDSHGCIDC